MYVFEERESKIDKIKIIRNITITINYLSFLLYFPIIYLSFKNIKQLSKIRIINLFIIATSIGQGMTFTFGYHNMQESLCILKGPLNLSFLLSQLASATAYVYIAFCQMWRTDENKHKWLFPLTMSISTIIVPFTVAGLLIKFNSRFTPDYNHPCWITRKDSCIILFIICFASLFVSIGFLHRSMYKLHKFEEINPDSKELCMKYRKRLRSYILLLAFTSVIYFIKIGLYIYELHDNIIRNFWLNLIRYLLDITNGPLFVIVFCYDDTSVLEIQKMCNLNRKDTQSPENILTEINDEEDLNSSIL